jgi:hypothetical protein
VTVPDPPTGMDPLAPPIAGVVGVPNVDLAPGDSVVLTQTESVIDTIDAPDVDGRRRATFTDGRVLYFYAGDLTPTYGPGG